MAHVLIGWEFGANRGHVTRVLELAQALEADGHRIGFAMQRPDLVSPEQRRGRTVWQAPVSPRLLVSAASPPRGIPTGMGDILARLGMDDAGIVAGVVAAWAQLFEAVRPDLVLGDFTPFMLLAARGRLPSLLVGNGFLTPPADLPVFPPLIGREPSENEAAALRSVNEGLARIAAPPIAALPQCFDAGARIPAIFAEFDPYSEHRHEAVASPLASGFDAEAADGEEIFVYLPETVDADSPLWAGLAATRLPVRVHVSGMTGALQAKLAGSGFAVEPEPVPFAAIAARSRLVLSHGGVGFVCAAAAAGLPQVVCHYDLEKLLVGVAVARHGLGGHLSIGSVEPSAFAASLVQLYRDDALAARARETAQALRGRGQIPYDLAVREAVGRLA